MGKRSIVVGLLLVGAGVSVCGWVFSEQRKEQALSEQYHQKWEEDLSKVDRMMAGETGVHQGMNIGDNEPDYTKLRNLQAKMENLEMAMTASIVCMLSGGAVLSISFVYGFGKASASAWERLTGFARRLTRRGEKTGEEETENEAVVELEAPAAKEKEQEEPEKKAKRFNAIRHSLLHNATRGSDDLSEAGEYGAEDFLGKKHKCQAEDTSIAGLRRNIRRTTFAEAPEESKELENSLRAQAEGLEKQIQEIREMTQTVQQAAAEQSEPLNTTLMDLTQQVSAIREYTTQQQERVKRLQEGYDWNIIRTFCLRMIRCIDNLEARISERREQKKGASELEEIRDELVFALESSGVEQFEPAVNSEYRGQEKFAEAVKEKVISADSQLKGRVAEILRPGYQYVVTEDNVKVVRTAQVKLFDCEEIQ